MKAMYKSMLPVFAGVAMLISAASIAAAQNLKDQIVGTWTVVTAQVTKDGKMTEPQGPHPLGQLVFAERLPRFMLRPNHPLTLSSKLKK